MQDRACPQKFPFEVPSVAPSSFGTNLADTLRRFKSSVRMEWTEPVLIPTSATISCTVKRQSSSTFSQTWSITSSFRLVDGLPELGSLSTNARPSLKCLNYCLSEVGLRPHSQKLVESFELFLLEYHQVFDENLMQYFCSMRFVIEMKFAEKSKNRRIRATHLH